MPHTKLDPYTDYLVAAYRDPTILRDHLDDLDQFVEYSRRNDADLVVVVFPFLTDLRLSETYTRPVNEFFRARGVPVVDVAALVSDVPIRRRLVNRNDEHPSVLVHRRVSDQLFELLAREHPDG